MMRAFGLSNRSSARWTNPRRRFAVAVVGATLLAITPAGGAAPAADAGKAQSLFFDLPAPKGSKTGDGPAVLRSRFVGIHRFLLEKGEGPPGSRPIKKDAIRLNLFPGVSLTAVRERVELRTPVRFTWRGRIKGVKKSRVIFTVEMGSVTGEIKLPGALYRIKPAGGRAHIIYQMRPPK